eukprot:gene3604-biopygen9780
MWCCSCFTDAPVKRLAVASSHSASASCSKLVSYPAEESPQPVSARVVPSLCVATAGCRVTCGREGRLPADSSTHTDQICRIHVLPPIPPRRNCRSVETSKSATFGRVDIHWTPKSCHDGLNAPPFNRPIPAAQGLRPLKRRGGGRRGHRCAARGAPAGAGRAARRADGHVGQGVAPGAQGSRPRRGEARHPHAGATFWGPWQHTRARRHRRHRIPGGTGHWRGHGAGVARAIGIFWLGVARVWRGRGAG